MFWLTSVILYLLKPRYRNLYSLLKQNTGRIQDFHGGGGGGGGAMSQHKGQRIVRHHEYKHSKIELT